MSNLLLPLRYNADRLQPMGDIVSSCVRDLDATIQASYAGTGTDWLNIETSPADSETQAQYDVEGTGVNQPTFTGITGNTDAYFSFDGNDFLLGKNSLTTFENNLHKTTGGSDFAFVMAIYYVSATQIFASNRAAGGANIGVFMFSSAGDNKLSFGQRGGSAPITVLSTATLNIGAWNIIAASHSHSTNESRLWVNTATGEDISHTYNTTTASASATKFTIGAYESGAAPLISGIRVRSFQEFNEYLTDAKMTGIINQLNLRHGTVYA